MDRIALLENRDGVAATVAWVQRTVGIYEAAIADPDRYGMYKDKMALEVEVFKSYLYKHRVADERGDRG